MQRKPCPVALKQASSQADHREEQHFSINGLLAAVTVELAHPVGHMEIMLGDAFLFASNSKNIIFSTIVIRLTFTICVCDPFLAVEYIFVVVGAGCQRDFKMK